MIGETASLQKEEPSGRTQMPPFMTSHGLPQFMDEASQFEEPEEEQVQEAPTQGLSSSSFAKLRTRALNEEREEMLIKMEQQPSVDQHASMFAN